METPLHVASEHPSSHHVNMRHTLSIYL